MGIRTCIVARPEPRSSGGKVTTVSGVRGVGGLPRRVLGAGPVAKMKNILVVEDEPEIARVIRDYLQAAGFTVSVAADGERALQSARTSHPDLVVLDLGLPGRDGLDVTRELRRTSDVPIVVVTARGDEADRIVGLELGADDYVVKPFSPKELVARVRALFRRVDARDEPGDIIRVADMEIDIPRMRVTVNGRAVELTASEFQLLAAMAREPGRVFTRGQLLDVLHGVAFESYERAIDAHVKNLRRKIEPEPGETRYVQTVYGVGYRFAG
jgi:two-component system alkaline phosphatase synthesis response regulator PhoP